MHDQFGVLTELVGEVNGRKANEMFVKRTGTGLGPLGPFHALVYEFCGMKLTRWTTRCERKTGRCAVTKMK